MRFTYTSRGSAFNLRRALLVLSLLALITLFLFQLSGLGFKELVLCSNGYCDVSAIEGSGVSLSVNVDYAVRYTVVSLVKPEGYTLKIIVYANASGSLTDISGPYLRFAGETGYIDIPCEVGQNFDVPILYLEAPIRHVVTLKVVEALEPGVLMASYEAPGLGISASLRYDLIVESLQVTVDKSGNYRLIVELLDGYKTVNILTLDCKGACHAPINLDTQVTAFNISIVEENIARSLSKLAITPLIALAALLAILELRSARARER
ncbi:MAG: hypothetical protein ACK4H7_01195 [Acidilobaceae archaeon]